MTVWYVLYKHTSTHSHMVHVCQCKYVTPSPCMLLHTPAGTILLFTGHFACLTTSLRTFLSFSPTSVTDLVMKESATYTLHGTNSHRTLPSVTFSTFFTSTNFDWVPSTVASWLKAYSGEISLCNRNRKRVYVGTVHTVLHGIQYWNMQ